MTVPPGLGVLYLTGLAFFALAMGVGLFNSIVVGRKIRLRLREGHGWTDEDIYGPRGSGPNTQRSRYRELVHRGGHAKLGDVTLDDLCLRARKNDHLAAGAAVFGGLTFLWIALLGH